MHACAKVQSGVSVKVVWTYFLLMFISKNKVHSDIVSMKRCSNRQKKLASIIILVRVLEG